MTVQRDPDAFAERWARRVLRPGPLTAAERTAIEQAVRRCYLAARLRPPAVVLWFPHPDGARVAHDRTALLRLLLAARPGIRRAQQVTRFLRPLWRAAWGGLAGAGAGLLLIFALLMAQALAGWLGLLVVLLAAYAVAFTRLRVRDRGPRAGRWAGYTLVALMLLALGSLAVGPDHLVTDVSQVRWPDVAARVLLPAGALLGSVLGCRSGWRAHPAALQRLVADVGGRIAADVSLRGRRAATGNHRLPALASRSSEPGGPPPSRAAWARESGLGLQSWLGRVAAPHHLLDWAWWTEGRPRSVWTAPDLWALAAHETTARAGWTALRRVAVLVEPPVAVHTGPNGVGRWDGPAVEWADGSVWYALDGVRLPRCPADGGWTADEVHAVRNTEVRRIMIETIGWDAYLTQAGADLVTAVPDPGNPGQHLALYEAPAGFGDGVRLLLMTNASPDRSGVLRRYAETVPDRFDDPVEAVAWQYGVPADVYRGLQRRT